MSYTDWKTCFDEARKFTAQHGRVHRHAGIDTNSGAHLGKWVARQHELIKMNKLSPARTRLLEVLPGAHPSHRINSNWENIWTSLRPMLVKYGLNIPEQHTHQGTSLSSIIARIMIRTDPTAIALQNLCRETAGETPDDAWATALAEAIRTKDTEWIGAQLTNRDNNHLDQWQEMAMSSIPAQLLEEALFQRNYNMLFEYIVSTGESNPKAGTCVGGTDIGQFADTQRRLMDNGLLDDNRAESLAVLPGWSSIVGGRNNRSTRSLANTFLAAMEIGGFPLELGSASTWMQDARVMRNANKLSDRQLMFANATPGFTWGQRQHGVTIFVDACVKYVQEHGQLAYTPWTRSDDLDLGAWLCRMNPRMRDHLTNAGLTISQVPDPLKGKTLWNHMFTLLEEWVQEADGDTPGVDVKIGEVPLGAWYWTVSYLAERGLLPVEQVRNLRTAIAGHNWHDHYVAVAIALEDGTMGRLRRRTQAWVEQVRRWRAIGVRNQQVQALEELEGFTWEHDGYDRFSEAVAEIKALVKKQKVRLQLVERDDVIDGVALGRFIWIQQELYRTGKLPGWKIRELESIKGWVWTIDPLGISQRTTKQWIAMLREWQSNHGPIIPARTVVVGEYLLGGWLESMRQRYQHRGVASSLVAELEQIPGWTWQPTAEHIGAHGC